ncbi:MAG: paraquat-inducible protein A [Myxococcales bacterium]|nr:paraquat-inducible membrane protein A [Myxococcales bacterium]HIK86494.1 paraquat-inducible membrane protein A [Myxococcales bacterium]
MKSSTNALGGRHTQCSICNLVMAVPEDVAAEQLGCSRCGAMIQRRKPNSLPRTAAFLLAAAICYIPANVYPIVEITSFGYQQSDTIISGVIYLLLHGNLALGVIVFVASVVVPILKIILLSMLLISVQCRSQWRPRDRARIYRIVEVVGRWSMVDVYVVTILVALLHLGSIASVEVEQGAIFFSVVVVLTLLAAQSFDPRLIWDPIEDGDE